MSTKFEYEIDQHVMVPLRGLCRVVKINEETMLGQTLKFVHLEPAEGSGIIKMPTRQLEEQGVRPLVSKETILEGLEPGGPVEDMSEVDSVDRLERWMDMVKNGDYNSRIQVLRELVLVSKRDRLDTQEKKFQKMVHLAARHEIQNVFETSAAGAGRRLNAAIK